MPQAKIHDDTLLEIQSLGAWARSQALPLWCRIGKREPACFQEQLDLNGVPISSLPRRTMVQARQISVYCLAAKRGWLNQEETVLRAAEHLYTHHWSDEAPRGWVFSASPTGETADNTRDLYAHAFVLFGLSHLLGMGDDNIVHAQIRRTLEALEESFFDRAGAGYWDSVPLKDAMRRQNPHMHLLEAFLSLANVTRDRYFLDKAKDLVTLALQKFITEEGAIFEEYDSNWSPYPSPSLARVEPGHQFEWAWLLRQYENLANISLGSTVERMISSAITNGLNRSNGRIVNETNISGVVTDKRSRVWPHTEALRCLAHETRLGNADFQLEIRVIIRRLMTVFCESRFGGGWIDRVGPNDEALSETMPASTLYHVVSALDELELLVGDE